LRGAGREPPNGEPAFRAQTIGAMGKT
jgi:hypothetical protein